MSKTNIAEAALKSLINELPSRDTKLQATNLMDTLRRAQGVDNDGDAMSGNREDFNKLVAARLWIVHPEDKKVELHGRPFKALKGLPTRFAEKQAFWATFEGTRNGQKHVHSFEGRDGVLRHEVPSEDGGKTLVEAGSYTLTPIGKIPVMVTKTETFMDNSYSEQVEQDCPAYDLGDGKFIASFGFSYLLTMTIVKPRPTTVTYVVYNCSRATVSKNRAQFGRKLESWNKMSEANRDVTRAPKLMPESYLMREEHLDIIIKGETKFVAQLVDTNSILGTPVVDQEPEAVVTESNDDIAF